MPFPFFGCTSFPYETLDGVNTAGLMGTLLHYPEYASSPAWNRRISAVRPPRAGGEMVLFDLGSSQDIDYRN